MLILVNDWVKHAESKAGATLAAAGVIGGVLYGLVKGQHHPSIALDAASVICGVLTLAAALFGGLSLAPRVRSREEPVSVLYFHHIARRHARRAGSARYAEALQALVSDDRQMINEIAGQIWANAHVARDKYRWGNLGLLMILLALPALAATALIIPIH